MISNRWLLGACALMTSVAVGCESEPTTPESTDVEIFSWWVHPGEADALDALLGVVHTQAPELTVKNSGASVDFGTDTQKVLNDRLQRGEPPDTFQVHGGAELINQWVSVSGDDSQNRMEPLNFLYDAQGWRNVFPPKLIDILSYKGNIYSVPVNIHRGNVLFYNKKMFADLGIQPPTTWAEFFTAADAIKLANKIPLALGGKNDFGLGMIFDSTLLAKGGAKYYGKFFDGTASPGTDPEVDATVQVLVQVMNYVEPDAGTKSWSDAADLVRSGDAAMTIMGDWCKGYLKQQGFNPDEDGGFGAIPAPDTAGSFVFITDTFGLPKGAPHRDNTIELLTVIGTREAEDAFNPIKGSIPARTDADRSQYDAMANRTMDDYLAASMSGDENKGLVPSLAHGSAASPAFLTDFNAAMATFLTNPDGNALKQTLVNIYPRLSN